MTKLVKNGIFVIRMVYMKKTYKVAGHVLSLEMPDGNVWQQMKNLVPFEIGEASPLIAFRQVENLAEQAPQPLLVSDDEGFPMITIGKTENGKWYFTMAPLNNLPVSCNCVASEDFSEVDFQIVNPRQAVFSINNTMMLVFALRTATLYTLEIHASVVMKGGKGFAFLGKSGTGKSTHSRMWLENIPGTELLNDDNPIIRITDGVARIYGSPWSGKTPCYKNASVELGAVVRIVRAPSNFTEKLSLTQSYACLFPSVSAYRPDRKIADGVHNTIVALVTSVPCYNMHCLPDGEAAKVCCNTVYGQEDGS